MAAKANAKARWRPYKVYLCGAEEGPLQVPNPECPNADLHTAAPVGYVAWHEWAARMGKSHRQHRCPGCGRLSIWRSK